MRSKKVRTVNGMVGEKWLRECLYYGEDTRLTMKSSGMQKEIVQRENTREKGWGDDGKKIVRGWKKRGGKNTYKEKEMPKEGAEE